MLKKYVFILSLAALAGCAANSTITGQWVQPIPGMEQQMQGFKLEKGGEASSINMATLLYEKWEKQGNTLTLYGKSIGNGQTLPFTESYTIQQLDASTLKLLSSYGSVFTYTRPK